MATARLRRPSAPAERLIAEVLRAQGEFFEAIRRPSEEFLAKAIDLPATFDPLDAETIRQAQLAYQRAFQQRSAERLRLGVRKAMREPTRQGLVRALRKQQRESDDPDVKVRIEQQVERVRSEPDPRRQAVTNLLETERRLARAHAAAMAGRAREASRAVQVRAESPTGAMWRRDPDSNSCEECIFLDGKLLPWEVVEQISPPRHPNCRCTLIPLGAARAQGWIRPNAKVPSVRQAIHRYRRLLQETIEGAILVEAVDRGLLHEAWGSTQARARQATDQLRVGTGHEEGGRFTAKVVPAIGSGDRATGAAAVGKSDLGDGSDLFRDDGKTIFGHTIPPGLRLATPEERRQSRVPPGYPLAYVPEDRAEMENGIVGVGVDKMGRVKRFYSDSAMAQRAQQKFERIRLLTPKLDRLDSDLVRDATEDDAAAAALLVRITGMRPGSERKTGGATEAFGATTLQARHVEVEGDTVTFDFIGKNGKRVQFPVSNAVLAGALGTRLEGKGPEEQLFPTVNENALNAWLKEALGGREYKTKDLRTALATATAQARVNELTPDAVPPGKQARQKLRLSIATEISERLGNTPAEVIKSYVDPGVWNALGL